MTQTDTEQGVQEPEAPGVDGRRNERSEISFPYSSLEDAEAVARAVFEWGGNDVGQDRIAATLDTTVKSSGFRTDMAATRIFGFIDGRGTLSLTPLGHRLVDEHTADKARVDAFKQVPLFNAIFEEHQGKVLPGPKGLEAEMLRLGVSPKQVTRARQLFQRSAQHAGFFNHSPERLVEPLITGSPATGANNGADRDPGRRSDVESNLSGMSEPLIAIWEKLLNEGEAMSAEQIKAAVIAARALREALAG